MKQARGAAKTTIKFKNLMRGNTIENTYRSGEKFETAMIEKKAAQYTYEDGVSTSCNTFEEINRMGMLYCIFRGGIPWFYETVNLTQTILSFPNLDGFHHNITINDDDDDT